MIIIIQDSLTFNRKNVTEGKLWRKENIGRIKAGQDGRRLIEEDKLTLMEESRLNIQPAWDNELKFGQNVAGQCHTAAYSAAESCLQSDNSCISKRKKRTTVQKRFAIDAKRAAKRYEVDLVKARMARRYNMEMSRSMYAVQF